LSKELKGGVECFNALFEFDIFVSFLGAVDFCPSLLSGVGNAIEKAAFLHFVVGDQWRAT
jgi:hypothetical protein